MRKYYTRPCNFYYGSCARKLVKNKRAFQLAGNKNIAFDQIEVFQRKKRGKTINNTYSIHEIKTLEREKKNTIKSDLKKIISERKSICGIEFKNPQIIGVLNVTPDSFSDGGLFFNQFKAFNHAKDMIVNGAKIIDIGGESTRPGSKTVNEKKEWQRIENIITHSELLILLANHLLRLLYMKSNL